MAENSKIEWTDHTFNPWIGCTKISPNGCKHCYAEELVQRFGDDFAQRRRTSEANWKLPLKWNRQAEREGRRFRVFCASLADVFDNQAPAEWRAHLFCLIAATPHLDWLLLTKRIGNARPMIAEATATVEHYNPGIKPWTTAAPWPNVWIGATVVNQEEADRDIPKLLAVPAAKRFLSMEPLLGPVDLTRIDVNGDCEIYPLKGTTECVDSEHEPCDDLPALDWVIVGGESGRGPDIRPMHPQWARDLRDQCAAAGVPFLFKQHGEWREPLEGERFDTSMGGAAKPPAFIVSKDSGTVHCFHSAHIVDGKAVIRVGKRAAGRLLDGRTHDEFPIPSHPGRGNWGSSMSPSPHCPPQSTTKRAPHETHHPHPRRLHPQRLRPGPSRHRPQQPAQRGGPHRGLQALPLLQHHQARHHDAGPPRGRAARRARGCGGGAEAMSRFQFICMERGCGPCGVKLIDAVYLETRTHDGELIASESAPRLVSTCCGAGFEIWDNRTEDTAVHQAAIAEQKPFTQRPAPQAEPKGTATNKGPHNGNDKEPRDPDSYPYLDARGDDEGQGLDSYWKWGYAAGWNDHKKHAAQAPAVGAVTWTQADAEEWGERHDLRIHGNDLFCAFEDAATLHLTRPAASGCKVTPYEPTQEMIGAVKRFDPALPLEHIRAIWWAMWGASKPPVQPNCESQSAPQAEQQAVPPKFDVRRIMLSVVPGEDGMGHEVFAKNVDEVVAALTDLGVKLEDASGELVSARAALAAQQAEREPIDMVLHCPKCGMQHIDAPERKDCGDCHRGGCEVGKCSIGAFTAKMYLDSAWKNPPHRSHLCHGCGHVWRPADVPTNGVQAVKTKGKADSPVAQQAEREPLSQAAQDVLAERQRQINVEGWTPEHDDEHADGALSAAAMAYLDWVHGEYQEGAVPLSWPAGWALAWFKPSDDERNLVKAAALILAELERRYRAHGIGHQVPGHGSGQ